MAKKRYISLPYTYESLRKINPKDFDLEAYVEARIEAAIGDPSTYLEAEVLISDAQLKVLRTTPVDIVPAPAAGKIAIPVGDGLYVLNRAGGAYGGASAAAFSFEVSWGNRDVVITPSLSIAMNNTNYQLGEFRFLANGTNLQLNSVSGIVGKKLVISSGAANNLTGGSSSNYMRVKFLYTIIDA